MALITFIERSSIAKVVPTGASAFISAAFTSAAEANLRPSSTISPNNWYKTLLGSLYGRKLMLSLIAPLGTSTSLNSPGIIGVSSPLILSPLAFNPPGRLDNVPASTNWRSNEVADLARPPIIWIKPNP